MSLISEIHSPEDLKKSILPCFTQLCAEIRNLIIDVVFQNGHLAPNLGVVELTIALHRVFSVPRDKIVWDVGHQSYIHKILTGRLRDFPSCTYGGLFLFQNAAKILVMRLERGMPAPPISAALGMACARDLSGDDYNVIAVIRDGA